MIDYIVRIMNLTVSWNTSEEGAPAGDVTIATTHSQTQSEVNGNLITDDASKVMVTSLIGVLLVSLSASCAVLLYHPLVAVDW